MSKRLAMVAVVLGMCLVAGVAGAAVIQLTPASNGIVSIIGNNFLHDAGSLPGNAIDGNTTNNFFSTDSNNQHLFIAFDLGAQYILDHVEIWFYTDNANGNATITVGNDVRATITGDEGSGLRVKGVAGSVTEEMVAAGTGTAGIHSFTNVATAVAAQYVDIYATSGGFTGGFKEIKLYGELAPTGEIPEPATLLLVGTGALGVFGYARRRMMK